MWFPQKSTRTRSRAPWRRPADGSIPHRPATLPSSPRTERSARHEGFSSTPRPPRAVWICAIPKSRSCPINSESLELRTREIDGRPPFPFPALRNDQIKAGPGTEQQLFNIGPPALETAPFLDGHENSRLDAAAGYDLRAFLDRGIEKLAEASFRIL